MFPSGGINTKPIFITKIEDKNGNLLKSFVAEQKEIINENTAFKMVRLMRGVIDNGTGRRMRFRYGINAEIAGKTGTTNSQADAWFIGYTPQILAGAWVGCDDRYLRFSTEQFGQGAAAALPIWAYFIKKCYSDKSLGIDPDSKFIEPEGFDDCGGTYDQTSIGVNGGYNNDNSNGEGDPLEEVETIPEDQW
jgi:penicillin-binding protein 1A